MVSACWFKNVRINSSCSSISLRKLNVPCEETDRPREGIIKLRLTAVPDAQHGWVHDGLEPSILGDGQLAFRQLDSTLKPPGKGGYTFLEFLGQSTNFSNSGDDHALVVSSGLAFEGLRNGVEHAALAKRIASDETVQVFDRDKFPKAFQLVGIGRLDAYGDL